jgi:CDP-diacylglycerol--glycerol-3-phosphate 3-phosphatidyltransferase
VNLPNWITISRLLITAVLFVLLEVEADPADPSATMIWIAFALFVIAAATDFVDGWVARRYGQVTPFGRVADPFVDKVLICGVLIALLRFPSTGQVLHSWMVILIIAREFLVTTLRGFAEAQGVPFPADSLGKWKMVVQSVTAAALLTMVAGTAFWRPVAAIGMWVTILLTVWSGAQYVWKARRLLRAA